MNISVIVAGIWTPLQFKVKNDNAHQNIHQHSHFCLIFSFVFMHVIISLQKIVPAGVSRDRLNDGLRWSVTGSEEEGEGRTKKGGGGQKIPFQ